MPADTTAPDIAGLRRRIEAAEGPDRELDGKPLAEPVPDHAGEGETP